MINFYTAYAPKYNAPAFRGNTVNFPNKPTKPLGPNKLDNGQITDTVELGLLSKISQREQDIKEALDIIKNAETITIGEGYPEDITGSSVLSCDQKTLFINKTKDKPTIFISDLSPDNTADSIEVKLYNRDIKKIKDAFIKHTPVKALNVFKDMGIREEGLGSFLNTLADLTLEDKLKWEETERTETLLINEAKHKGFIIESITEQFEDGTFHRIAISKPAKGNEIPPAIVFENLDPFANRKLNQAIKDKTKNTSNREKDIDYLKALGFVTVNDLPEVLKKLGLVPQ